MAFCPSCGVEVNNKKCPLCSYEIKQDINKKAFIEKENIKNKHIKLSQREKMVIFDISTWFFTILVASICLTVDILNSSKVSWSIIPIIPVTSFAIIATISINIKGFLKVISIFTVVILMLFALDLFIPGANSIKISVPVVIISSLLSLIIVLLFKRSKKRGVNIAGYITIALTIVLIAIEITVRLSLDLNPELTWSLITTVTLLPISLFLLYIHYNLSKKIDLNKIFHT